MNIYFQKAFVTRELTCPADDPVYLPSLLRIKYVIEPLRGAKFFLSNFFFAT